MPKAAVHRTSDSGSYAVVARLATAWTHRYTRSADPRFAAERESELAFELWEHAAAADRDGWSGPRAAVSLMIASAVSAPRDLWWCWRTARDHVPPLLPVRLIRRRRRPRTWVPLQQGHTFDQTNGVIEGERALPYERPNRSWGAAGNVFGLQGGF